MTVVFILMVVWVVITKILFGDKDHIATDMLFANYNWGPSHLRGSVSTAQRLGRSSFDYYAGFDIQGRGLRQPSWSALLNNDISIGFWGAHSQSLIHQSATDNGTSDIAIQKTYLKKQELMFSGGYTIQVCYQPSIQIVIWQMQA